MSSFLLDVNVLIALVDSAHVQHDTAHEWFAARGHLDWATCPLTQNGVVRILGNPRYPNSPGTPAAVIQLMRGLWALPGHRFWPDDLQLFDDRWVDSSRILDAGQVTDTYLLALARAHEGQLATFDRRLVSAAVRGGKSCLHLIS